MIHYRIPIRGLKVSTNKIYAGTHWSKRKAIKDSVLSVAGYFCRPIKKVESYPIEISYKFIFSTRALDTLNCAYLAKMFEDSLCSLGIIEDDDPQHVTRSILEVDDQSSKKTKKTVDVQRKKFDTENEDYVEITINSL